MEMRASSKKKTLMRVWFIKRILFSIVAVCIISGIHAQNIFAADGIWMNIGLEGMPITAIAIDTTNTNIIYAGTTAGVYKSTNGGSSWSAVNTGLISTGAEITAIAIDSANTNIIYAGTTAGVYKSTNGGSSWSASGAINYISNLKIDSRTSEIYLSTLNDVYKSTNGGASWYWLYSTPSNSYCEYPICTQNSGSIAGLAIDPNVAWGSNIGSVIYVATQDSGVFRSLDGGSYWYADNYGLPVIVVPPQNSPPSCNRFLDPYDPDYCPFCNPPSYCLPTEYVGGLNTLAIDSVSNTFYVGVGTEIYKKQLDPWSGSWSIVGSVGYVYDIAIDPSNTSIIYAGIYGRGVYKSTDGGVNWYEMYTATPMNDVAALVIDPTNSGKLYAGTDKGIFKLIPNNDINVPTVPGQNVNVTPIDPTTVTTPVDITFDNVTGSGTTSVSTSDTGPALPAGFKLGDPPTFYEITTTALYSGQIQVCINYSGTSFTDESGLKLFHYESSNWIDVTSSLDTVNDIICGITSSLSPFAVLEPSCIDNDGDGYGSPGSASCLKGDALDCNDNDAGMCPGAEEVCDGKDNDCNGVVDENYVFAGFQQPINTDGSSIFKAGRTIPVKIRLTDCGGQSISTAIVTITVNKLSSTVTGTVAEQSIDSSGSANTGNLFRYDAAKEQYIFNLNTKGYTKGSYKIYAKPDKGSGYSINFSLK